MRASARWAAWIVAICGSSRTGSHNGALLDRLVELAPDGTVVEPHGIEGVPLYDQDREERDGIPEPVQALKDAVREADGLLLVSPEYNHSVPGPLKNAIDWMTRPPSTIDDVFGGRPVAVAGATPGEGGTRLAQRAWSPVFAALGMVPYWERDLQVSRSGRKFDDDGQLVDVDTRERARAFIEGFAEFCESMPESAAA